MKYVPNNAGTFYGQGGLKIVRSCQRSGGFVPPLPECTLLGAGHSRPILIDIKCMPTQVTGTFSE